MNNTPWYKSWFDTAYYHTLYKHRNDVEAQRFMNNLMLDLKPATAAHILDLACGKGRHSKFLNEKGYRVTGVDLSEQSIAYAQQFANDNLDFAVHDLREVYKPNTFNFILNLFTSFGYFDNEEDNYLAVNAMKEGLTEDGVLIIDFMNSFKSAANLRAKESKTIDGISFNIKRFLDGKTFVKEIEFKDDGRWHKYEERVQGLIQKDFEAYFNKANLELVEVYGSYDLDYFSKNTSDRLILKAKRA